MENRDNRKYETDSLRRVISLALLLIILVALGAALGLMVGWIIGRWIVTG